ncbi:MAG: phosphoglycerate kinase [Peptococcaceae bacterium]|jgi:phosphoglycerate kinase|nr:phosphoglycerate kinase [Peptococcaceae bacterium]
MNKKTIRDIPVRGRRIFVRVDFNVPVDAAGRITNDARIKAALPTIQYLIANGAKLILASHFGRPKGQVAEKYSLASVGVCLQKLLGVKVTLAPDCIGSEVQSLVDQLADGQVLLLENVRFHAEEEKNDPEFARQLASLAEVYVNDAFGAAHRAHASTAGIAQYLPAVAGFLMEKEVCITSQALEDPKRPFVTIIGGAKISDKIGVIRHLTAIVDALIIGGGMANTFLRAQGNATGKSLVEEDKVDLAGELLREAQEQGVEILLPVDVVVAKEITDTAPSRTVKLSGIAPDEMILDIGPESVAVYASHIAAAKTIIWNGPMGVFETPQFASGTQGVARAVAACPGTTIVGGGDTVTAVEQVGLGAQYTHVSTGGGASLEFIEGKVLPGVAALADKD